MRTTFPADHHPRHHHAGKHSSLVAGLKVVHSSWGRLRIHLPHWSGKGERQLATKLRRLRGVSQADANSITRNILLLYDPALASEESLLAEVRSLTPSPDPKDAPHAKEAKEARTAHAHERHDRPLPSIIKEGTGKHRRARIAVKGLNRDPQLTRRVVRHLEDKHEVKVHASPLTGRLLVEYNHDRVHLEDLICELMSLELPELPEEDDPEHPLDPKPLFQSSTRTIGSLVGLGVLTIQRLMSPTPPFSQGAGWADTAVGVVNLLQGFPFIKNGLRSLLGQHAADLIFNSLGIVTLTLANSPLGLMVLGSEALILLSEVTGRRGAWRRYEDQLDSAVSATPGAIVRLEAGMKVPRLAKVIEGFGTATARTGLPMPLQPGDQVASGATVAGGPFVMELVGGAAYEAQPRPAPPARTLYQKYVRIVAPVSLAFGVVNGLRFLSINRLFESLLLVNPRTALIGQEASNLMAANRALRSGLTVVGSRPERTIQLPDSLLLDGPRLLTDGLEVIRFFPPEKEDHLRNLAGTVSHAAGSPWGNVFSAATAIPGARSGYFNGLWASAVIEGVRYTLGPPEDLDAFPDDLLLECQGGYFLEVRQEVDDDHSTLVGALALQPKLRSGAADLVAACKRYGVVLELLTHTGPASTQAIARRLGIPLTEGKDLQGVIAARQQQGKIVALVGDGADSAPGFAACDLAIGMHYGRGGPFPARADLLAPDLRAVADLMEAGHRRKLAVRDGVCLSAVSNVAGAVFGMMGGEMGAERAGAGMYIAALATLGAGWYRLGGGERLASTLSHLVDPRPERWGRRSPARVLKAFNTSENGLTTAEAVSRRLAPDAQTQRDELLAALRNQLRAPITALLLGGAGVTLVLGQALNTSLLAMTISINVAAGVWQERQVGQAAAAIKQLGAATARVLRDGKTIKIPTEEVVTGDILVLTPGDRVAADARVLEAWGLELDEAALTGESLPMPKGPNESSHMGRVVLEGSGVVVGTGMAVVVAVGRRTRMGATAEALRLDPLPESPLGARLGRLLRWGLPVALGGGVVTAIAGLLYGGSAVGQITIGVITALSAIPEGLPLIAGIGQAGAAGRLAKKKALVRRLAAVEALGRVDVTCTDKTGTLTEGRLALRLLADDQKEILLPGPVPTSLRRLLLTAALASPHPDASNAATHPTDLAIVRGAREAGLERDLHVKRLDEVPFDSARAFYASLVGSPPSGGGSRLCIKGAPERIVPRCTRIMRDGSVQDLTDDDRQLLLAEANRLASRGLRILMAAEGPPDATPSDPQGLTALGFVGISDPLRTTVPEAVRRCQEAGVRIIMLTGDHPATARTIAREAGLLVPGHADVVTASTLAELTPEELDQRMKSIAAVARAAPLDKLRIIESLKRSGHTVAMTGDGVNDAPSLRLADVGVAMGKTGTEVARQAADVVLAEDDFASLVEAFVEGRGFWRNMRAGLGLLIGGNAGELGVIVGGNALGLGSPMTPVQILIVNLITDALPCLAVVLQKPPHKHLVQLSREGVGALDSGLRFDVLRRGLATAIPSLASFIFTHQTSGAEQARAVAFTTVIATQLAQTLEVGLVEGSLSPPVMGAVGVSAIMLGAAVGIPPVRNFLGLMSPSLSGWGLVGVSSVGAVLISRAIALAGKTVEVLTTPAPEKPKLPLPAPVGS
jgi:cation-transporting P-type ATPase I